MDVNVSRSSSMNSRPLPAQTVDVSRESGSALGTTFSQSERFNNKLIGRGRDSPKNKLFYANNNRYPSWHEGLSCSQGFGARPKVEAEGLPTVGPGSYDLVASSNGKRSPLDGPQYCSTSIHQQLPSALIPKDHPSPGPVYQVRKPLDHGRPHYGRERLSHGGRHNYPEDTDNPEMLNPQNYTVAASASCPNLIGNPLSQPGGTKQCLKTTFGTSDRFKSVKQSSGPSGGRPLKMGTGCQDKKSVGLSTCEDYLSKSRSCSFGSGQRTNFANPYRGHTMAVSPVSYFPVASQVGKTSSFDGQASRCVSPIFSFSKSLNSTKVLPAAVLDAQ